LTILTHLWAFGGLSDRAFGAAMRGFCRYQIPAL
jgi:hypothetical protein